MLCHNQIMFGKLWDKLLDTSVFYSFDSTGFKRHQKYFEFDDENLNLKNQHLLVTGGSSGIGLAAVREFYIREASQLIICRDKKKATDNISKFYKSSDKVEIDLVTADMAAYHEVIEAMENRKHYPFNVVVFNAGGMPSQKLLNAFGYENIFASQVIGHYVLLRWLIDRNLLAPGCRIIWVSSGGMYLKKLELDDLNYVQSEYDKIGAYANAKRAQVILNEELSKKYSEKGWTFSCMHPGWVDTEAVKEALPDFHRRTQKRLRNSDEGADTIVWLSTVQKELKSGKFWFDRKIRGIYPFFWTKENKEVREKLLDLLETQYQAATATLQ
jgi:dehydrogenase/reductase SDR family member 12